MPAMTLDDVKSLIKDVLNEEMADKWEEIRARAEEANRKFAPHILAGNRQEESPSDPSTKGMRAARFLRALAAAKGDPDRAAKIARDKFRDEEVAKALGESTLEGGGALVPEEFAAEVIDLLRARAVVRGLGATSVPMPNGNLTMRYLASGSTANYVGESQRIPKSEQTLGRLHLSAKKLAALTPISNDLLRDASPLADRIVRDDLVRTMALREDLGFIRDDGSAHKPKGMRYWADSGNVFARTQAGSASTLAEVIADLGKAVRLLEEADVPIERGGWIFTPRIKWFLMTLLDSNGNKVFWDEMMRGTLLTHPFRTTTQIPNNLGAGDESEVYFADFAFLMIGEVSGIEVDVFQGGAYHDGTEIQSGISNDETVLRAIARHDFGARYRGKEISVITTVDWGA